MPKNPRATNAESQAASSERVREKKRLNLDLTPEAYELLQKLANDSGKNMADILRTGLALYSIAQEESRKGRSLAIAEGEKVVKEIITT